MVNGDDVLRVTTTRRWYRRIHEDAAAERILASMILIITLPLLSHSRRAENGNHLASLADVDSLLRGLVRTHNVCHAGRVQEVLNRLVAVANRARTALTLAESAVVEPRRRWWRRRAGSRRRNSPLPRCSCPRSLRSASSTGRGSSDCRRRTPSRGVKESPKRGCKDMFTARSSWLPRSMNTLSGSMIF